MDAKGRGNLGVWEDSVWPQLSDRGQAALCPRSPCGHRLRGQNSCPHPCFPPSLAHLHPHPSRCLRLEQSHKRENHSPPRCACRLLRPYFFWLLRRLINGLPLDVIIKGSTELRAAFPPLLGRAWGAPPSRAAVMDSVIMGFAGGWGGARAVGGTALSPAGS